METGCLSVTHTLTTVPKSSWTELMCKHTHLLYHTHTQISYITHAWISMRIRCSHIQIQQQDLPHFQTQDLCQVIFRGSFLLNSSSKSSTYSHLHSTSTKLSYTKHMAYWTKYPPNKLWSKVCACVSERVCWPEGQWLPSMRQHSGHLEGTRASEGRRWERG